MNEAAIVGYPVTFTPEDGINYNSAARMATLDVIPVPSGIVEPPKSVNSVYNGYDAAKNRTVKATNVTLSGAQSGNYTIADVRS